MKRKEMGGSDGAAAKCARKGEGGVAKMSFSTPEGVELVQLVGRVYHKRVVGEKLCFLDCATVFDNNATKLQTSDDHSVGLVEVCVCEEASNETDRLEKLLGRFTYARVKNVKAGDVLLVKGYVDTVSPQPRSPKLQLVKAIDFCILEPWEGTNKFESQLELHPKKRITFTWSWAHMDFFVQPVALPYALMQCNFHMSERLCQYFNVHDSSNYTKCRILHVTEKTNPLNADDSSAWKTFMDGSLSDSVDHTRSKFSPRDSDEASPDTLLGKRTPLYLHSNIQRMSFVNVKRPFVSLAEVTELLQLHHEMVAEAQRQKDASGPAQDPVAAAREEEDRLYRLHRLVTFPRILETKIKAHLEGPIGEAARANAAEAIKQDHEKDQKKKANKTPVVMETEDFRNHQGMMQSLGTSAVWQMSHYYASKVERTQDAEGQKAARREYYRTLIASALAERQRMFGDAVGQYEEYDQVCLSEGLYWVGLSVPRVVIPEARTTVPSGAYWKLQEIKERYLCTPERIARYSSRSVSVDIGASPGGWSYCSAQDFDTRYCFAVDPAETYHELLTPLLVEDKGRAVASIVQHQKDATPVPPAERRILTYLQKGQEFIDEVLIANGVKVGLYVCDINDHLEKAVEMAECVHKAGLFERPALVVLTFKNTVKSKARFTENKEKSIEKLKQWLSNVTEIHLFANTQLETTVVGELL
eukprot:TRINITY_DN982_c1_g1_i1.p1 TRINITY_DN982_c1_g1~~TRINITY_DN982_c1_g1_i1.p1  ORF type:complete len:711 (+),score=309.94 TRINITY_DN982_c1_g1_i1:34-2133(+)